MNLRLTCSFFCEMILRFVNKLKSFSADERFAEIFKGSVFSLGSRVIATLLSLITSILVARLYGAEVVGVLAIINAFLTLVTIFTVLGTGTSILRLIPEHVAKFSVSSAYHIYRKVQYLVTGVSLVSGALFIAVSGIVADKLFGKSHLSSYFALAAGFVVFKALADLGTQAVRGLRLIRTFAIMQVLPQAAMLLFLLVSIVLCNCPEAPVYAQLGAFAPVAVSGIWIMEHSFRCRMAPMDTVHPVSVREVLSISTPMLMTASMQFFIGQTGVVLLGVFRSEAEVGYYSIAVKLATLTTFILQAVNSMAAPKFSELFHSGRIDDLFYVANKTANLIFWVSVPVLFGLILFGKAILYFLFGSTYREVSALSIRSKTNVVLVTLKLILKIPILSLSEIANFFSV